MLYLQWYLDRSDKGLKAAKLLDAEVSTDGAWPVARLYCANHKEALLLWWAIWKLWGINSHTHHNAN